MRFINFAFLAWAAIGLSVAGCGDDTDGTGGTGATGATGGSGGSGAGGSGGDPYTGPCTPLALSDTTIFFQAFSRTALAVPVTPPIPGLAKTRLTMELYEDDGSGTLGPVEEGTFAFATPPDDNYGTCQHCMLLVGYDNTNMPKRAFYPKNGTMTIDKLDQDDYSIVAGSIERSEIVEVTQNQDLTWSVIPNGACYYLESWTFDTTPNDGAPCTSNEECANELQQICDPASGKCAPPQCSLTFDPPFCEDDQTCLSQNVDPGEDVTGSAVGACYDNCDPEAQDCGDGFYCRPLGPTQSFGVCLKSGTRAVGEDCVPRDISTECVPGAVCWGEPGKCAKVCNYLSVNTGCDAGTHCSVSNLCKPESAGDPAAVGEACMMGARIPGECGPEPGAFAGLCLSFFPEDPVSTCERACRTEDPDCPGTETCLGVFSNPVVGICRLPAVCGDGNVDVIGGEICDDMNTASGDGCASDCKSAEFGPLCALATPLSLNVDINGTTVGGPRGYPSNCDPYVAIPVRTYSYLPTAPGRLELRLSSASDLGIGVYSDCANGDSGLNCDNFPGDDTLLVDVPTIPIAPLLIAVRGSSPLVAGSFTLRASYVPAVCGDGLVGGPEACDDMNTVDGDGCSGDCTTIEWPTFCANLPPLNTNATINGTTVGGTENFNTSQVCTYKSGLERAYAYTAPSNGDLELTLTQPSADFSLFIQDDCGPVDGMDGLACANSAFQGMNEMITVALTAGQRITVVVDGFTQAEEGPFALTASFTPQ
jgi:cysteine-rich repeat protein